MSRNKALFGLALLVSSIALTATSQAGQASGELGISLTIANSCQVSSSFDPASGRYQVRPQNCGVDSRYRLTSEPVATDRANVDQQDDADQGRTLVTLYW
ncbi:hypothetical protein SA496_14560 [Pseudomonas sp. JS3066]|uniref:hypothetical protein n=1 Tax=unclassified Pseudomonas TaxID=196821 RepID=UPI00129DF99A|nr:MULTISPECIES: hypothetical protein [unclassified Pseudomonas]MDH4653889.1 hypothetical protein [Pseudomonas sp. BN606]MRK22706.1 hypothetical protein [Pseudomonas sp. JG-B]WVK90967.1 hypothetical protein SA496_14560 [Pseudomonas sp. JS3066]